MVDATNNSVISGTPRMNSMKATQTIRSAGKCDIRPSANAIPSGREKTIPVTPMTRVNMMPPNRLVGTGSRPIPPISSQPMTNRRNQRVPQTQLAVRDIVEQYRYQRRNHHDE